MANDRLYLACRTCGEVGPLLVKWWGGDVTLWSKEPNRQAEFLAEHLLLCRPPDAKPHGVAIEGGISWVMLVDEAYAPRSASEGQSKETRADIGLWVDSLIKPFGVPPSIRQHIRHALERSGEPPPGADADLLGSPLTLGDDTITPIQFVAPASARHLLEGRPDVVFAPSFEEAEAARRHGPEDPNRSATREAQLVRALLSVRTLTSTDGLPCWCRSRPVDAPHSDACREARALVALPTGT